MLRCVQVLRRLMVRNKDIGVFCNIAAATLGNPATFRAISRLSRRQPRDCALLHDRIHPELVPQFRADRDRAPRRAGAARLSLLDRSRHRSADRTARTRRPRRSLHQGPGGAAARSRQRAPRDIHPPISPTCSAATASTSSPSGSRANARWSICSISTCASDRVSCSRRRARCGRSRRCQRQSAPGNRCTGSPMTRESSFGRLDAGPGRSAARHR